MFSSGMRAGFCGFQTREEGRSLLNAPTHTLTAFTTSGKHFLFICTILRRKRIPTFTSKVRERSLFKDNRKQDSPSCTPIKIRRKGFRSDQILTYHTLQPRSEGLETTLVHSSKNVSARVFRTDCYSTLHYRYHMVLCYVKISNVQPMRQNNIQLKKIRFLCVSFSDSLNVRLNAECLNAS